MAKRQTETKIWTTQRWYRKLHPYYKLAWKYLIDVCDHAGIWKVDYGQLVDDTGMEDFNMSEFIRACNTDFDPETGQKIFRERLKYVTKGVLWITGFVKFQYENKDFLINPDVPAIKSALQILNGHGILQEGLEKGYLTLSKPFGTVRPPENTQLPAPQPILKNVENEVIKEEETLIQPTGNPPKPLNNPSITLQVGIERTKDKDRDKDILSKGYRELEDIEEKKIQESNPEESKRELKKVFVDNEVGQCWNVEEYFETHQAIFEVICMNYHNRYKPPEIKEILGKFHLWNIQKDQYPQKPSQLKAGFELWLKNEKNIQKNGSATSKSFESHKRNNRTGIANGHDPTAIEITGFNGPS